MTTQHLMFIALVATAVHVTNSQINTLPKVSVQNSNVTLGEDANIKCYYTLSDTTRTLYSVQWLNSTSAGDELNILVNTLISNPNSRYQVDITIETPQTGVATLTIINIDLPDDGYYQCRIVDSSGETGEDYGKLDVNLNAQPTSVTVMVPDTVKVAEDAIISCIYTLVTADSLLQLVWTKADQDGQQVGDTLLATGQTTNGRYRLSNDNDLIITNVKVNDTSNYLCKITTTKENSANDHASLTVQYLNNPVLEPQELSVMVNETAMFTCSSLDGVPTPITVTWCKGDVILNTADTDKYSYSDSALIINKVNVSDEGDYQCRAENAAYRGMQGKLSNTASLKLDCKYTHIPLSLTSFLDEKRTTTAAAAVLLLPPLLLLLCYCC
ncbi:protein amalgam-like [Antedon mediterranea]|uniref:protein amalgam-like n=1 Tax=Antedon mediterranea TaxID=105859 RepID=UPI003AF49FA7